MNRTQKEEQIALLNNIFSEAGVVIVTQNTGLKVSEITDLRKQMRVAGGSFKVAKNSLVKIALKGTEYEKMAEMFSGPTCIAFSDDVVSAPKVVASFSKINEKLVIVGGAMGQKTLNVGEVRSLAELPSLDELRAKLLSIINTPATRIAGVLQASGGQLARVISAYSSKSSS